MRKIEREMGRAVIEFRNWKRGNTEVRAARLERIARVYLHGNLIAEITDTYVRFSSGGWRTNTTKSRLNALTHYVKARGIYQRNYEWFYEDGTPFIENSYAGEPPHDAFDGGTTGADDSTENPVWQRHFQKHGRSHSSHRPAN